jgi:hypothetical protein
MPSGDAQRVWWPEMIEMLREEWRASLEMDELIALRDRLDEVLQRTRDEANILPPMMTCPKCGTRARGARHHVSVRALILAAGRFDIAPIEEMKAVEKAWARHRKEHDLDPDGRRIGSPESRRHRHG